MNATSDPIDDTSHPRSLHEKRLARLSERSLIIGTGFLRYGLAFLLVFFGAFKFFQFEAEGIKPLLEHSPLMSWLLALLGTRGASNFLGVFEIATGLLIASRRWRPRLSAAASWAAVFMFAVTLSFLVTTPGALAPGSEIGGFLMKDIILMGAALYTAGEAWRAGTPRPKAEAARMKAANAATRKAQ